MPRLARQFRQVESALSCCTGVTRVKETFSLANATNSCYASRTAVVNAMLEKFVAMLQELLRKSITRFYTSQRRLQQLSQRFWPLKGVLHHS